MATVLGIDSSTQACKVEVRDLETGRVVEGGRNPHPPTTPPRSEQHPDAWWQALEPLLEGPGRGVGALSVAGQQHGMVVLDRDRAVIRPAKLWNDTTSAPQARALVDRLGAAWWAARCGTVPVASLTVTKLAWLREHEPAAHARVRHVVLPHDWLTFRLTGELVTDRGEASGTGYWSPAEGAWLPDVLELVGLEGAVVPAVLGPTERAGVWRGAAVGPGTGDNMAAALGLGLRPGDVVVSIGTSGTVFTVATAATADPTGAVAGFADAAGRFLPLVCTLNATKVTDAVGRLLGVAHDELAALALAAPPGAGGVVLVPYLDGERTPDRPDATGTLAGLRSDLQREQVARAAFEGVVCGLLDGLDALAAAGVEVAAGRLLVVGGGARSPAFVRVLADLAQRPVVVPEPAEHVAAGACVQAAAVATGASPEEVADAWSLGGGTTVDPTDVAAPEIRAAYRATAGL